MRRQYTSQTQQTKRSLHELKNETHNGNNWLRYKEKLACTYSCNGSHWRHARSGTSNSHRDRLVILFRFSFRRLKAYTYTHTRPMYGAEWCSFYCCVASCLFLKRHGKQWWISCCFMSEFQVCVRERACEQRHPVEIVFTARKTPLRLTYHAPLFDLANALVRNQLRCQYTLAGYYCWWRHICIEFDSSIQKREMEIKQNIQTKNQKERVALANGMTLGRSVGGFLQQNIITNAT